MQVQRLPQPSGTAHVRAARPLIVNAWLGV